MFINNYFKLSDRDTTIGQEITGGITTFLALSYIIFVQPTVLSSCGMDPSAVMFATCVCSAAACFIMGLWANLPVALAPAMGHNFFFAFTVCGATTMGGFGLSWQEALAANFIAGMLFLLLSSLGLRGAIMRAIPQNITYAIAAGIGLLIALVGLEWAGIIVRHPVVYVKLGSLLNPISLLSIFGLLLIAALLSLHFRGAILVGMAITAAVGYIATKWLGGNWGYELVSASTNTALPHVSATFGKLFEALPKLIGRGGATVVLVVFIFLLLDVFDTIGTLIGLGRRANLLDNQGQLPNARRAMLADAGGTVLGAIFGSSTITSYVESGAGIAVGARTGLAAVTTGVLMLLSLLLYPFLQIFGTAVEIPAAMLGGFGDQTVTCYPVVAPVLIIVGCYMLPMVRYIEWDDFSQALPAFLTIVVMQFSMSITDGIAWGFISTAVLSVLTGKSRRCSPAVYICSLLFILYYLFGRPG
ncbi:MAG: NCS2 family permease [Sedimentisphaerales bacterium]|nr:NCS2 family permease [Sedimentisphaerales bacterium]